MISDELEKTLQRAKKIAESFNHEYMTIEHLLFSMIEDEDVKDVLVFGEKNPIIGKIVSAKVQIDHDIDEKIIKQKIIIKKFVIL